MAESVPIPPSETQRRERPSWMLPLSTIILLAGVAALYVPTFTTLARTIWVTDEQGHGPIILAVALWLAWQRRQALSDLPDKPTAVPGWGLLLIGLFSYVLGRSQGIDTVEVGSALLVLAGLLLISKGWGGLRVMAFPLFFLLFMIPLPGLLVQTITIPLKASVSWVAEHLLFNAGYPVARSGVILQVGQYQLLVADACAGLNSMFTLEALCLLYLNLMRYQDTVRNAFLAVMAIPVAFVANVTRVVILILVTFHFGDEAGQGFVHGFAGMVLFLVALVLLLTIDGIFGSVRKRFGRDPVRG